VLAEAQRRGDAALALLVRVIDILEPELAAVAEEAQEVACGVAAGHHHDVADARAAQRLQRIVDHGLVVHRQEMLVRDLGQWTEPRAEAAREDDALHAGPRCAYCRA